MGHLAKFVDSIAASPTVRLDLNDETTWTCTRFDPGVPTIRRAMSSNAMTDGIHVSSSSYDARTITFDLLLRTSTQDLNATQIQTLARELDRATNIVMYQPNGLTKPVFFKTFRSNLSQIQDILTSTAMRTCTIELLAEPFALGLMETVSVGTVNNDPAHATNGCYFDIAAASVIGDVATPCLIVDTVAAGDSGYWAVRQRGTPSDTVLFYQAESGWSLIDFANPGGGPDAAMSGTGTNNYVRSSSSTPRLTRAVTGTDAERFARAGSWRVLAVVRTSALDTWSIRFNEGELGYTSTTSRHVVDLGVHDFGGNINPGLNAPTHAPAGDLSWVIFFNRLTGAGTIDVDCIQFLPADECLGVYNMNSTTFDHVFDASLERAYNIETTGSLFAGTTYTDSYGDVAGGFISLVPNQTNRVVWIKYDIDPTLTYSKTATSSLTVYYWPRYLFIRPSAT